MARAGVVGDQELAPPDQGTQRAEPQGWIDENVQGLPGRGGEALGDLLLLGPQRGDDASTVARGHLVGQGGIFLGRPTLC